MDTIETIKENIRLLELRIEQFDIPIEQQVFILKDKGLEELKSLEKVLEYKLAAYYVTKMNNKYRNSYKKMSIQPLEISAASQMTIKELELFYYHFNLDYKYSILARTQPNHKIIDSYLLTTDNMEDTYNKLLLETRKQSPPYSVSSLYSFIKSKR